MTRTIQPLPVQPIRKLLIANRGEIAVRVMRTARQMGIQTVAIYSDADRDSPHVHAADQAICVGAPAPAQSYLNIPVIIAAAQKAEADAIHPGYGFLAENEDFAQACADAGIRFVGPSAAAIAAMGDKAQAKQRMRIAQVPCIPGYDGDDQSAGLLKEQALKIGFPIMIKASAGGGGRGMRRVDDPEQWDHALTLAQSEAKSAFGDSRVILERALTRPRHIEIQVLADSYGHTLYLGERDCSIQRRHQKIVEEAPSPAVDEALRQRMGEVAVRVAQNIGYTGAGTIEFLLDASGEFYFMEMNTRLQVEHPVTEAITGLDLVQWQLRIAQGEHLSLQQADIHLKGHAIEVRLCAEDPAADFLPQTGVVKKWTTATHARTDHALRDGYEISPWYDSMLAKIIVHGASREQACAKMAHALQQTQAVGVKTNRDFLRQLVTHPAFIRGDTNTHFIPDHFADNASRAEKPGDLLYVVAACQMALPPHAAHAHHAYPAELHGFNSNACKAVPIKLQWGQHTRQAGVTQQGHGPCTVIWADGATESAADVSTDQAASARNTMEWVKHLNTTAAGSTWQVAFDGMIHSVTSLQIGDTWVISDTERSCEFTDLRLQPAQQEQDGTLDTTIKSPMNGRVVAIKVEPGDGIRPKQALVVLEAMKMEHSISARRDATIQTIHVQVGQQVSPGQLLVTLDAPVPDTGASPT